ncbi:unnamed protein product [Amoebophrya sp. A120]|nr:unnamed protein product [Amoebophrya sp. A120]|eukprot:GSA120T00001596001.1
MQCKPQLEIDSQFEISMARTASPCRVSVGTSTLQSICLSSSSSCMRANAALVVSKAGTTAGRPAPPNANPPHANVHNVLTFTTGPVNAQSFANTDELRGLATFALVDDIQARVWRSYLPEIVAEARHLRHQALETPLCRLFSLRHQRDEHLHREYYVTDSEEGSSYVSSSYVGSPVHQPSSPANQGSATVLGHEAEEPPAAEGRVIFGAGEKSGCRSPGLESGERFLGDEERAADVDVPAPEQGTDPLPTVGPPHRRASDTEQMTGSRSAFVGATCVEPAAASWEFAHLELTSPAARNGIGGSAGPFSNTSTTKGLDLACLVALREKFSVREQKEAVNQYADPVFRKERYAIENSPYARALIRSSPSARAAPGRGSEASEVSEEPGCENLDQPRTESDAQLRASNKLPVRTRTSSQREDAAANSAYPTSWSEILSSPVHVDFGTAHSSSKLRRTRVDLDCSVCRSVLSVRENSVSKKMVCLPCGHAVCEGACLQEILDLFPGHDRLVCPSCGSC